MRKLTFWYYYSLIYSLLSLALSPYLSCLIRPPHPSINLACLVYIRRSDVAGAQGGKGTFHFLGNSINDKLLLFQDACGKFTGECPKFWISEAFSRVGVDQIEEDCLEDIRVSFACGPGLLDISECLSVECLGLIVVDRWEAAQDACTDHSGTNGKHFWLGIAIVLKSAALQLTEILRSQ